MAGIYDERILGAKQQAETARKLREGIVTPQGQMVDGIYVAPSWTQHAANLFKSYTTGKDEREALGQAKELEAKKAADVAEALRQMGPQEQSIYSDVGPQMPTRMPTEQERMAALLRGASVAPDQFQPMIQMEQWQQGIADKQTAREEAAALKREQMAATEQLRRDQMAQEERLSRMNIEGRMDAARLAAALRPEKMVTVMDTDGNPVTVPQSQMAGMPLYSPSAAKQMQEAKTKQKGREQLSDDLQSLAGSYRSLKEGGGAVSTQQGTLANIGAKLAGTGLGQFIGSAVGTENQAQRDTIEAMRPMLMQSIKAATGMSAQQMNSDADVRLMMKITSDPNSSIEANMAILDKLDKKFGLGIGISQPGETLAPKSTTGTIKRFNPATGRIE